MNRPSGAPLLLALCATVGLLAAVARAQDRVVQLPPLIVEESRKDKDDHPWRYAEAPGFEVLSRCGDSSAGDFARGFSRINWLVTALVPESLLTQLSAPQLLLLCTSEQVRELPREIAASAQRPRPGEDTPNRARIDVLPNLTLRDEDFIATYSIIHERLFNGDSMKLTPETFRERLEQRTPALPRWFIEGVMRLYQSSHTDRTEFTLNPAFWVTFDETKALRNEPDHARSIMALGEMFRARTAAEAGAPDTLAAPWHAQSALFIRWALDGGKKKSRRDALWRFVARSAESGATEELFQQCFGLDYADAQERLSDYLPTAAKNSLTLAPLTPQPKLKVAFRNATPAEIARIKGDWERLSVTYVRSAYPSAATNYLEQSRLTLTHATDRGERDPRLLAVLALSYCDNNQYTDALPLLESAATAEVKRPRIYFELARLRYLTLSQDLPKADSRFNDIQTASILDPLRTARALTPPSTTAYDLAARTLLRAERSPTAEDIAWIAEGARLFPQNVVLNLQAAAVHLRFGAMPETEEFINHGLSLDLDASSRRAFEQLRTKLAAARR